MNEKVNEIVKIVRFTLEDAFHSHRIYFLPPEGEDEKLPIMIFKGVIRGEPINIQLPVEELIALYDNAELNNHLLEIRENFFKEFHK